MSHEQLKNEILYKISYQTISRLLAKGLISKAEFEKIEKLNIDMVITKSVSRFARNVKDFLETIRELKSRNIAIFFEKENINTLSDLSEVMLTILSSIAQEEVISISQNNKWAIQKRFKSGNWVPHSLPYGYRKDDNGEIAIVKSEADIVKRIFNDYLCGKGFYTITKELNEEEVPFGESIEGWTIGTVNNILKNDMYIGDLLMQKTYTTDIVPFKKRINTGQKEQYLVTDNHEPIVSRHMMERISEITKYRQKNQRVDLRNKKHSNRYTFSGKIMCHECGSNLKRQLIYIGKPYEAVQWCCTKHIENRNVCGTKAVPEETIQKAFVKMRNKLKNNSGQILNPLLNDLRRLHYNIDCKSLIENINYRMSELTEQSHVLSRLRSKGYIESAIFIEKENNIHCELAELRNRRGHLFKELYDGESIEKTEELIANLNTLISITYEFDEAEFEKLVDKIIIHSKREITFRLKNGLEIIEI